MAESAYKNSYDFLVLVALLFAAQAVLSASLDNSEYGQINRSIENYQDKIKQLELEYGIYHPSLHESLISLGNAFSELKQYDQARQYLERALINHRINNGLHSESQIPIVQNLIDANINANNWQALNNNYIYLEWLYRRVFVHGSERLILPIEKLANAKLELYQKDTTIFSQEQLINTVNLYQKIIDLTEGNAAYLPNRLEALYGLSKANYYLAVYTSDLNRRLLRTGNPTRDEIRRNEFQIRVAYSDGKKALTQLVEEHVQNPQLSKSSHVLALTYLADWHLLSADRNKAKSLYIEAYELLRRIEPESENLKLLFSKPVQIPVLNTSFALSEPAIDMDELPSLKVTLDISESGQVRNIVVNEGSFEIRSRTKRIIKNQLRNSVFRPRFEAGAPVRTKNMQLNYLLANSKTENEK